MLLNGKQLKDSSVTVEKLDPAILANKVWKEAVRAATTANITLTGTQIIDGVSLIAGDRVLVKNQTTALGNGIYVVASGSWARSTDADTAAKLLPNSTVFVQEGTVNADKQFTLTTNAPITLGTTNLTFTQTGGAANSAAYPVSSNKGMTASVTSTDGQAATATTLAATPANGSYIQVFVNGQKQTLGDGVKTKDCYFSSDSGTTARAFSAIATGDTLYWNGSIAGFQLAATDKIDFDYSV